jgi:hypothetical protein
VARWQTDDVDVACEAWAYQWVHAFAKSPDRASRAIGPLGCTLGRVMERHDGASSNTEHDRHWPEVFLGQGLIVAIALRVMSASSRELIGAHYIWRCYNPETWKAFKRPMKQSAVAHQLGVSLAEYYHRRDTAKACIRVALCLDTKEIAAAREQGVSVAQVA